MPKVYTQISDIELAIIKDSGKTSYQFVQEAVAEKIQNDQKQKELNEYQEVLEKVMRDFKEDINKSLMKSIEVHLVERTNAEKKLDEFLKIQTTSRDAFQGAFTKIKDSLETLTKRV
jgi:hypothetical protein